MAFLIRALSAIILFGLINIYAAGRIIKRWPWAEQHAAGAWLFVLAFFILQMIGPFGDHMFFPILKKKYNAARLVSVLNWVSYMAFGIMSLLVVYGLAIDAVSIICQIFISSFNPEVFDRYALYGIAIVTLATTVIGVRYIMMGPQVKEVDIPLRNLPPSFDGFKIAQISDLHIGSTIGRRYTQNVVDIVNDLKPDLVALTGDFVDGSVEDLAHDVEPLSALQASCGVFFITGNHEYYSGAFDWIDEFKRLGARVLLNQHVLISRGGENIILAGVTDYTAVSMVESHASDPVKALAGAPPGLIKILLAHQPASCHTAAEAGFDLQLTGHAHGGQFFPFTFLVRFFQQYYKGLNRHNGMWIYVNRGTGYWGPPMRTGAPCEITLITLRREALGD